MRRRLVLVAAFGAALAGLVPPGAAAAQDVPPTGRAAVEALSFEELRFHPPEPEVREVEGVRVFHLHDPTLALVDVLARFEGGYGRFGRESYAAGTALPSLLRTGGTADLSPDTVDARLEGLALQTSFGGSGGAISATVNTLSSTLEPALELWWSMLTRPAFDPDAVEVWRGREMESVRRRVDDPGRLAFSEFNRLMYGDHPIGWEMTTDDLAPERVAPERLRDVHGRIVCRDHLVLGVAGDVTWARVEPLLTAMVRSLPPCTEPLPDAPLPEIRREPGVFLIPRELDQSTVVVAHTTPLRQGATPEFFASRIGNTLLGAGGFSSRLLSRLRTEEGFAYSAASLWTTPERYDGLVGATTRTGSSTTVAALRAMMDVFEGMRTRAPRADEVQDAVDEFVHGFVFAFESSAQIVSRRMAYEATGLPADWLERYVEGIQAVDPEAIREVFATHLDPARLTILVVGDPDGLDAPLESLGRGPVTVLDPDRPTSAPSGSPRSRR